MAFNMGVRGENGRGRYIPKSAYRMGDEETYGKRRKASVAKSILLRGGVFGLFSYESGRVEKPGTYNYESKRVNTKIKLDDGSEEKSVRPGQRENTFHTHRSRSHSGRASLRLP